MTYPDSSVSRSGPLPACARTILLLTAAIGSLLAASPTERRASERLAEERFLPHRVLAVSSDSGVEIKGAEVLAVLERDDRADIVVKIQELINREPDSPWRPSLESNLGLIQHQRGRYSLALAAFRSAWERTKHSSDGNGKAIADGTLPSLLHLLSSLGRTEELGAILKEIADRPLPAGPVTLAREYAYDAYHTMFHYPGKSYRCGTFALGAVGRVLNLPEEKLSDLVDLPSGTNGFTIQELIQFSEERGIPLLAVSKPSGAKLVVPSVIHWKENHYAAIIEEKNGRFLVVDPTFGEPRWISGADIELETSGVFLVPAKQSDGWRTLNPTEAASIFGKGLTNNIADWQDNGCNKGKSCPSCPGVPVWWVTEPFLNLWIADEPLSYGTKRGEQVSFRVSYKQRDTLPKTPTSNPLFVLPTWNHSWFSYIEARNTSWQQGQPVQLKWANWTATVYLKGGGELHFSKSQQTDEGTRIRLEPLQGPNANPVPNGPVPHNGFRLIYPDGTQEVFTTGADTSGTFAKAEFALTHQINSFGQTNEFQYNGGIGGWTLAKVIDYDGGTNTLTYTNNNKLLYEVKDPHGRYARFTYNASNWLASITDAEGMVSSFKYNSYGWVTNMTTPYGVTSFDYPQYFYDPSDPLGINDPSGNSGGHNRINRAVRVTEPNGGKQLFVYRYDTSNVGLPSGFGANEIPAGTPLGTLDSAGASSDYTSFEFRNSFYWGQKQYAALSTAILTNLVAADYKLARIKHWLEDTNALTTSGTLSIERDPSPDTIQNGLTTWYDYKGKTAWHREGTETSPAVIARRLPGETTSYVYNQYNLDGFVTNITTTYTQTNGVVGTRSARFTYDPNTTWYFWRQNGSTYSSNSITSHNLLRTFHDFDGGTNTFAGHEKFTNSLIYYISPVPIPPAPPGQDTNEVVWQGTWTQPKYWTNAVQEKTEFTWDAKRRLQLVSTPAGAAQLYSWNATSGLLDYIQNTAGGTNSFTWTNGLVRTHKDERGLVRTNTWDNLNRLLQTDYSSDGTSEQYSYTLEGGATNWTGGAKIMEMVKGKDRNGNWSRFKYTPLRKLEQIIDAENHTNRFTYCGCGTLESIQNGVNETTSFLYDYQLRRTQIIHPDTSTVTFGYNLLGQLTQVKDPFQQTFTFGYNNQGLHASASNQVGRVQAVIYDIKNRPVFVTDANNVTQANKFDYLDRLVEKSLPDQSRERFGYTKNYLFPTTYTNALTDVTAMGYDAANRLLSASVPGVLSHLFKYNEAGDLVTYTNGNSFKATWEYTLEGRLKFKKDHNNNVILSQYYFPNGWLSNRVDANGLSTKFLYDQVGNLKSNIYPTRVEVFAYDAADRLKTFSDPAGSHSLDYMTNGLIKSESGPWATVNYSYTNLHRQKMSIPLPNGTTLHQVYGYDVARRLETITSAAGSFQNYFQGASPLLKGLKLHTAGSLTNTFDSTLYRMASTSLKNPLGSVLSSHSYLYDLAGQVKTNTRPDAKVIYGYDKIGQLVTASGFESNGTTPRPQETFGYGYDPAGNLAARTNGVSQLLTQVFTPDNRNRLAGISSSGTLTVAGFASSGATSVTVNEGAATLYADKTFSRSGVSLSEPSFRAVATDAQGQTVRDTIPNTFSGAGSPSYNANGNLTAHGNRSFAYDEENRLTTVTVNNTATRSSRSEFVYDALGRRRIAKEYTNNQESRPAFVTGSLGAVRNNYSGWVGFKFTVGNVPVAVSELGRWVVAGNAGVHALKLVTLGGTDVAGGATTVNTLGATPGQFVYAPLAKPITLAANTSYYLASQETFNGDQWCEGDSVLYNTGVAAINNAAYSGDGFNFNLGGSAGNSYVPVNFKVLGTPLVTQVSLSGILRNDYSGWVGSKLVVGPQAIKVHQLGRWIVSGNSSAHTVKLVAANGTDVSGGSVSVATSGAVTNQFSYVPLASPVTLTANTTYYLVSQEVFGGDQWYEYNSQLSTTTAGVISSAAYGNPSSTLFSFGNTGNSYVPVGLTYTTDAWTLAQETRYIYDGRLVVQERDGNNNPTVTYTRGLDLSGSRTGAGGIGGLLARTEHDLFGGTSHAYYHSDLGGNVARMINQNGHEVAKYIYDSFGNTIAAAGPLAEANKHRFSSKELHSASGLSYYDYRYYDPSLQRWLTEDPIGEFGGWNLHQAFFNAPTSLVDRNGRDNLNFTGYPGIQQNFVQAVTAPVSAFPAKLVNPIPLEVPLDPVGSLQTTLDAAGVIDPTPFSDGFNSLIYLSQGDLSNAGISIAGMVPFLGDAAKAKRLSGAAADCVKKGTGGDFVDLYRAVSPEEFADVFKTGGFRPAPGGGSLLGKQFGHDLNEVVKLADHLPDTAAIIRARVPREVFNQLDHTPVDSFILRSGATTVQPGQLDTFNSSIVELFQAY